MSESTIVYGVSRGTLGEQTSCKEERSEERVEKRQCGKGGPGRRETTDCLAG